jgi:hypothetical protein
VVSLSSGKKSPICECSTPADSHARGKSQPGSDDAPYHPQQPRTVPRPCNALARTYNRTTPTLAPIRGLSANRKNGNAAPACLDDFRDSGESSATTRTCRSARRGRPGERKSARQPHRIQRDPTRSNRKSARQPHRTCRSARRGRPGEQVARAGRSLPAITGLKSQLRYQPDRFNTLQKIFNQSREPIRPKPTLQND